jgi:hypothetical protein
LIHARERPVAADHATQYAVTGLLAKLVFSEPEAGGRVVAGIEGGADFEALGTAANRLCITPLAERQRERIDEDGFAGAGFAGQRCKAGIEIDRDGFDDGQVADMQLTQH